MVGPLFILKVCVRVTPIAVHEKLCESKSFHSNSPLDISFTHWNGMEIAMVCILHYRCIS